MGSNLRDFSSTFNSCGGERENVEKKDVEKQAEDLISKYKNMSNDELAITLFNEVARQKANGTFNREQLLKVLDMIKPMLKSETQYIQLRQVIQDL